MSPIENQNPVEAFAFTPGRADLALHPIGVLITRIPSLSNTRSAPPPYLKSWSWMRNRTGTPNWLSSQLTFLAYWLTL